MSVEEQISTVLMEELIHFLFRGMFSKPVLAIFRAENLFETVQKFGTIHFPQDTTGFIFAQPNDRMNGLYLDSTPKLRGWCAYTYRRIPDEDDEVIEIRPGNQAPQQLAESDTDDPEYLPDLVDSSDDEDEVENEAERVTRRKKLFPTNYMVPQLMGEALKTKIENVYMAQLRWNDRDLGTFLFIYFLNIS